MQNTVYESKQNGEDFFSLPAVTCSRFGNCPANGLITRQPQYSVIICIFTTWQNAETLFINDLRFTSPICFSLRSRVYSTPTATLSPPR